MDAKIIGREDEIKILQRLLSSKDAELLAIYGRRRVGKTFLIKTFYADHMVFTCTGQLSGTTTQQLVNFTKQLYTCFPEKKPQPAPQTWQEAFQQLRECIDGIKARGKKVLFFDELPWLDTHKSGFLSAFGYFWNMYVPGRDDLLVVICGSAASWMIKKVVHNKGGLHNRITQRIRLQPFTLKETETYLQHRKINLTRYQVLQLYMVMGGVPHYLNAIERGLSVPQQVEKICFDKDGLLSGEFENLYAALFSSSEKHIKVVRALAQKNKGLTRGELLAAGKLLTGGGLTVILDEMEESGFIEKTQPYNKQVKESLFRLTDEFSLFYLKFMEGSQNREKGQWLARSTTPAYLSWCGYAFENICLKHVGQIKKALGIGSVYSIQSSWYKAGGKQSDGAQIDLLIDRNDQCINICEMKFSTTAYTIDKKYAAALQRKKMVFRQDTGTNKALLLTFVTTYGLSDNAYKVQSVDNAVTMDALYD
jgi:AAA+ ATPase superfamily predicted ATPase